MGIDLKKKIRDIPDFPKKGILFRDITPLLKDPEALKFAVNQLAKPFQKTKVDVVAAIESRGFIFGSPLALKFKAAFVPIRKMGKLPSKTIRASYSLEYGTDHLEIHEDAIKRGQKVLLVDDLLATGGTMEAAKTLVEQTGGKVAGMAFLVELSFLEGRKKFQGYSIVSLVMY